MQRIIIINSSVNENSILDKDYGKQWSVLFRAFN